MIGKPGTRLQYRRKGNLTPLLKQLLPWLRDGAELRIGHTYRTKAGIERTYMQLCRPGEEREILWQTQEALWSIFGWPDQDGWSEVGTDTYVLSEKGLEIAREILRDRSKDTPWRQYPHVGSLKNHSRQRRMGG